MKHLWKYPSVALNGWRIFYKNKRAKFEIFLRIFLNCFFCYSFLGKTKQLLIFQVNAKNLSSVRSFLQLRTKKIVKGSLRKGKFSRNFFSTSFVLNILYYLHISQLFLCLFEFVSKSFFISSESSKLRCHVYPIRFGTLCSVFCLNTLFVHSWSF